MCVWCHPSCAAQTASGQLVRNTPSEEVLWGYTTQLAAVLRAAHSMGLALRPATLSATKVGSGTGITELTNA
jgi:hypothetical protein